MARKYKYAGKRYSKYQLGGAPQYRVHSFQGGGQYQDNTVAAAGQGGKGTTSSIVFQESDPAVLQAKIQAMQEEKERLRAEGDQAAGTIQELKATGEQAAVDAAANVGAKAEAIGGLGSEALNLADEAGAFEKIQERGKLRDEARIESAVTSAGQGMSTAMADKANQQLIEKFGPDVFSKTHSADELVKIKNFQNWGTTEGMSGLTPDMTGGGTAIDLTGTSAQTPSYSWNPSGGGAPSAPTPIPGSENVIEIANQPGSVVESVGTVGGNQAAASAAGRFAAEGVGTGVGKWATSGAGLGTLASLAGTGVKMLSDDDDATTMNFGEGAGAALAGAGTGMGAAATAGALYGSSLGPVGTAVGAGLGAIYGLGKGIYQRNKARKAKRKYEQKVKARKDKFNKELMSRYGAHAAATRGAEMAQKTYSGYDLGRNVTYRLGGRMEPLMKYI